MANVIIRICTDSLAFGDGGAVMDGINARRVRDEEIARILTSLAVEVAERGLHEIALVDRDGARCGALAIR